MRYPLFIRKLNKGISRVSGAIILLISALAVYEAIARHFFTSPTSWTLNFSCFIFLWAIFMGSAYAFQEHGHVAVDLLRDLIDKKNPSRKIRRVVSVIGYCVSCVVVIVFFYGGWRLCVKAIELDQLAPVMFYFPLIWVYPAIVVGSALMLLTLAFIIMDFRMIMSPVAIKEKHIFNINLTFINGLEPVESPEVR